MTRLTTMQRILFPLRRATALGLFTLCLTPAAAWASDTSILANTDVLFDLCMQRCNEPTRLGALTRKGCEEGCYEARRNFSLRGKSFKDYDRCAEKIDKIELKRDILISEQQEWCLENFTHLHDRKGCKDAMEVFYGKANKETVCQRRSGALKTALPQTGAPVPGITALPEIKDTPKYQSAPVRKNAAGKVTAPPTAKKERVVQPPATKKPATPKAGTKSKVSAQSGSKQAVPVTATRKSNTTGTAAKNATSPTPEKDTPYTPPPVELDTPKQHNATSTAPVTPAVAGTPSVPQVKMPTPPTVNAPSLPQPESPTVAPAGAPAGATPAPMSQPAVHTPQPQGVTAAPGEPLLAPSVPATPAEPAVPVPAPLPAAIPAQQVPAMPEQPTHQSPSPVVLPDGAPLPAVPFEEAPKASATAPAAIPPNDPVAPALVLTPLPPPLDGAPQGKTVPLPALHEPRPGTTAQ